jgi:hypothetical protein
MMDIAQNENPSDPIEQLRRRLGRLEPQQIIAWRQMTPAQRLDLAFQAYQFALEAVRLTERRQHPNLTEQEADFISAEDIILAKLFAFKQTGSEKHLRDARGVLVVQWSNSI